MRLRRPAVGWLLPAAALAVFLGGSGRARADLVLTPAGVNAGLQLSTFATGFPSVNDVGPLGIAFPSGGGVLVTDAPGNVRLFPSDSNGQSANGPGVRLLNPAYSVSNATGLTQVGSTIYMTQQANGAVVKVNSDGSFLQTVVTGPSHATGIFVNPANNHLLVSTANQNTTIYDVNPVAGSVRALFPVGGDGMAITPDGKTLYVANNANVVGYDMATGQVVFNSDPIPGADGVALGYGTLGGLLFANTNDADPGHIWEVTMATGVATLVATGGSRGDFVTVDPNDGSLLLTQTDRIVRLTAPQGGGFSPPAAPQGGGQLPEPSSLALFLLGAGGLAGWCWRRRKRLPT
jgi:DNA-binding beta-propeller fold protein YncE